MKINLRFSRGIILTIFVITFICSFTMVCFADAEREQNQYFLNAQCNDEFYVSCEAFGVADKDDKVTYLSNKLSRQSFYLEKFAKTNPNNAKIIYEDVQEVVEMIQDLDAETISTRLDAIISEYGYTMDKEEYKKQIQALHQEDEAGYQRGENTRSKDLLLEWLDILLEENKQKEIRDLLLWDSSGNPYILSWVRTNLENLTLISEADYVELHGPTVVLDSIDSRIIDSKYINGMWYYSARLVLVKSEFTYFHDLNLSTTEGMDKFKERNTPDGTMVFSNLAGSSIEMTVGSNIVIKDGVKYTLKEPVQKNFFVTLDFFEKCFPQRITEQLVAQNEFDEDSLNVKYLLFRPSTKPYTEKQLTFALGLAAPINIHNVGSSKNQYDRNGFQEHMNELVLVSALERNGSSGSISNMLRERLLPSTWNITDRESLLNAIGFLIYGGHNSVYMGATSNEELKQQVSWFFERYPDLGENGIVAWDLSRIAQLAQWGYLCGYLNLDETLEMQMIVSKEAQDRFNSWEEFYANYIAGYEFFQGGPDVEWNGQLGVRSYIINQMLTTGDGDFMGVPWDIDLAPL